MIGDEDSDSVRDINTTNGYICGGDQIHSIPSEFINIKGGEGWGG